MMQCFRSIARVGILGIVTACATVSEQRRVESSPPGDVLTRKELSTVVGSAPSAYSAVERLRPRFLVTRPGSETLRDAAPRIHVFINGTAAGDVDVLRSILTANVQSIRRITAVTAYTQLGTVGASDGVLMVQVR